MTEAEAYTMLTSTDWGMIRVPDFFYSLCDRRLKPPDEPRLAREVSRSDMIASGIWKEGSETLNKLSCRVIFRHRVPGSDKCRIPEDAPTESFVVTGDGALWPVLEMKRWIADNGSGEWCYTSRSVWFQLEEDAVAAKIRIDHT